MCKGTLSPSPMAVPPESQRQWQRDCYRGWPGRRWRAATRPICATMRSTLPAHRMVPCCTAATPNGSYDNQWGGGGQRFGASATPAPTSTPPPARLNPRRTEGRRTREDTRPASALELIEANLCPAASYNSDAMTPFRRAALRYLAAHSSDVGSDSFTTAWSCPCCPTTTDLLRRRPGPGAMVSLAAYTYPGLGARSWA